jgi:hypothetical protein
MGCNCVKTFSKDMIVLDLSVSNKQVNNIDKSLIKSPTKSDMSKAMPESEEMSRPRTRPRLDNISTFSPFRANSSKQNYNCI